MKKTVHIVLSLAAALLSVVIVRPSIADSAVLLEKRYPNYTEFIRERHNKYVKDENDTYLLTDVTKEGFGAFSPTDMALYIERSRNMYPDISRASLCFDDGTGIEIRDDSAKYGIYGLIDENGTVAEDGIDIDLSEPLIQQIEDLTILEREYDERGNVICQFRRNGEGKGIADTNGVAGYRWEYDKSGTALNRYNDRLIYEQYLGSDREPIATTDGYAAFRRQYDGKKLVKESYFDSQGNLTNRNDFGYAYFINEYGDDGSLSLTYYYDEDGNYLKMGSSYFHEFLQSLKGKKFIVSIKDDGSKSLTDTLINDLRELGLSSELEGKYRFSFYAVVSTDAVFEELSQERLTYSGFIDGKALEIISSGYNAGSLSSIKLDGIEYSMNSRGMNFVIVNNKLLDSVAVDTFIQEMPIIN